MLGLRQLIRDLPLSLLFTSLALTSTALPVQTSPLTPENFKSTISKGTWFIEYFSPHCGHCRKFAPTWGELVAQNVKGDHPGVSLQQVDCAMNGDLCDEYGVKGYPTMNIYKDGEFVEKFKASRELDELNKFLAKFADAPADVKTPSTAEAEKTQKTLETSITYNPDGEVLVLDDKTFQSTIDKGPAFVKFYAPWCGHCKKLAPTWEKLAKHLQSKLTIAEVNCDDHKALCTSQEIPGFPSLIYFTAGSKTEYNGGRKLEQLKTFAEKASASTTQAIKPEELEKHVGEDEVAYVLVHSGEENSPLLSSLKPLFAALLGTPMVYTISNPSTAFYDRFSIPSTSTFSLVAFKDRDSKTPTSVYSATPNTILSLTESEKAEVSTWLQTNRLPTSTELTQDSFQSIMNAPHRPLVVLGAVTKDNKEKVKEKFEEIGSKWRVRTGGTGKVNGTGREVIFAWMDVQRWKDWMKSMYGISAKASDELEDVDIVIANHKDLLYYNTGPNGAAIKLTNSATIFAAIEGAASGMVKPIHSENLVERVARYLNGRMTAFEAYVLNNPYYFVFLFGLAIVVFILVVKRFIMDDDPTGEQEYMRSKAGRLD